MEAQKVRTYRDAVRELLEAFGRRLGKEGFADQAMELAGPPPPGLDEVIPEEVYQGLVREAREDPVGIVLLLFAEGRRVRRFDVSRN